MATPTGMVQIEVVPEGREGLSFSCLFPVDWVRVPLPDEPFDPEDPTAFLPLVVGMAPYGAVVFSVAARPAFDDGTVQDWIEYLSERNELAVERIVEARVGPHPSVLVHATQPSDAGPMVCRSVFVEDGGRLYNLGAMAPAAIWSSVEGLLLSLVGSFRLRSSEGLTTPPMREMRADPVVSIGGESPAQSAPVVTDEPAPTAPIPSDPPPDGTPTIPAQVALAADASSLDPEHPLNANLRDNGAGLVPRVVSIRQNEKFAVVAAAAVESVFHVPLGWHVIDDGRRALIFDAGGRMQINLDLRPGTPDGYPALLDAILDGLSSSNPGFEHRRMELAGMPCLAIRNLDADGERLQQGYLVRESSRPDMALVCRVTANEDDMAFAMNTSEVVLTSLRSPSAEAGST